MGQIPLRISISMWDKPPLLQLLQFSSNKYNESMNLRFTKTMFKRENMFMHCIGLLQCVIFWSNGHRRGYLCVWSYMAHWLVPWMGFTQLKLWLLCLCYLEAVWVCGQYLEWVTTCLLECECDFTIWNLRAFAFLEAFGS